MALILDNKEELDKEIKVPVNENNSEIGIILYTDGSVRPTNPGYGGWGVHGYTYNNIKIDKPISVKSVEVETDDDCLINKKDNCIITNKGYLGSNKVDNSNTIYPVKPIIFIDGLGSHPNKVTNNYAELTALYKALEYIKDKNFKYITIFSDSQYVVFGMNQRISNYAKNGWVDRDGIPIINGDLWKNIYHLYNEILKTNSTISFHYVEAHVGIYGNELADSSAVTGMNYSTMKNI